MTTTTPATTTGELLQAILDERGDLYPALVVEVAADPQHPLHHRLDWNNETAGHQYRLIQAAALIRSVRLVYDEGPAGPKHLRAYVNVRQPEAAQSSYIPTEQALADPVVRQIVLRQMRREWATFQRRYEHFEEFGELIRHALDDITEGEA